MQIVGGTEVTTSKRLSSFRASGAWEREPKALSETLYQKHG